MTGDQGPRLFNILCCDSLSTETGHIWQPLGMMTGESPGNAETKLMLTGKLLLRSKEFEASLLQTSECCVLFCKSQKPAFRVSLSPLALMEAKKGVLNHAKVYFFRENECCDLSTSLAHPSLVQTRFPLRVS